MTDPHAGPYSDYLASYLGGSEEGKTKELHGHRLNGETFPVELSIGQFVSQEQLFMRGLFVISRNVNALSA